MNLLELLHNEKVVKTLETVDIQLKELIEPSIDDVGIKWKLVLIIETLLTKYGSNNKHIGEYFSRYADIQNDIDDLNEKIKEGGYSVDKDSFEGTVFEILKKELIDNKKLNYKYGK